MPHRPSPIAAPLLLLALLAPAAALARAGAAPLVPGGPRLEFERLTPREGLPSLNVRAIVQDRQGFMWFATASGLARYDGYEFKVYLPDPLDPRSISHNNTYALQEDRDGALWVGIRNGGLNRYDRAADAFTRYLHDPADPGSLSNDTVNVLHQDRDGALWVGTGAGLNRLDAATGKFVRFRHVPADPGSLSNDQVWAIAEDDQGRLWVGTDGGLNRLDRATGRFTRYRFDRSDPGSLSSDQVRALASDGQGGLWVGTFKGGLNHLDPRGGRFRRYPANPTDPHGLSHGDVYGLHQDGQGILWLTTFGGGLNRLDPRTGRFSRYLPVPGDPTSFSSESAHHIWQDRSGALWFATFTGGVNRLDPGARKFALYRHTPGDPRSLSHDFVWSVQEAPDGLLWIGTVGGGLNWLDPATGAFGAYRHDPQDPRSLLSDIVFGVSVGPSGAIWAATGGGLERLDPRTRSFRHFPVNPRTGRTFGSMVMAAVLEDRRGRVWLATDEGGVSRLDPGTGRITYFPHDPAVRDGPRAETAAQIFEDSRGAIWFATFGGGLLRLDPETERFTVYRHEPGNPASLSHDEVAAIHEDRDGLLWIGTGGGLNRLDPRTGVFKSWRTRDGLPADLVFGIIGDDRGDLWLNTLGGGLSRFDPRTERFRNYDESDGLQPGSELLPARARSRSGTFWVGGNAGLNAFRPEQLEDNPFVPPVVFTRFSLFNAPVVAGAPGSPLARDIDATDELVLTHEQSVLSFEFSALSYRAARKNQYAYRLEGFDRDWNRVDGRRRFASYTNLAPGSYTLRVKGSNNDGRWNEEGRSLRITVLPPWWRTRWFLGAVAAAVLAALGAIYAWRVGAVQRHNRALAAQVAARTAELAASNGELRAAKEAAEAANLAKSAFLATMSHELRTPLNAILGYAQMLLRDAGLDGRHRGALATVLHSGEHLLTLINDILDLAKVEAGKLELRLGRLRLSTFLGDLAAMMQVQARDRGLAFAFEAPPGVPDVVADETRLRQVLLNLLGNALKFTRAGEVALRVRALPPGTPGCARLAFSVSDTGVGIAPGEVDRIFRPFEQAGDQRLRAQGTGLGLAIARRLVALMGGRLGVESRAGQGTTFSFELAFPLAERDAAASARTLAITGYRRGPAAGPQPPLRVLVADDVPENRALIADLLGPLGFEVHEAADGRAAVELAARVRPDAIVMDTVMPVLDGVGATREIRALPGLAQVPIVTASASAFERDRQASLEAGSSAFLAKPLRVEALLEELGRLLGLTWLEAPPGPAAPPADPEPLVAPPAAELRALLELVRIGNLRRVLHEADRIAGLGPELVPFADRVRGLAREFDERGLLALLRRHLPDEAARPG